MLLRSAHPVRLVTGIAALALVVTGTACSSDDGGSSHTVTVTHSAPIAESSPKSDTLASAPAQAPEVAVMVDGARVQAAFSPRHCEWGDDHGRPQLDFDAGHDDAAGDLDVEINLTAPPTLDDLSLEIGNAEWETTDEDRAGARVTVDGDTYRVITRVTDDHDSARHADVDVTFTCTRG